MRYGVCLQRSKIVIRVIGIILLIFTAVFQAMAMLLVGIGGLFLKGVAVLMSAAAFLMWLFTSFSGYNALIVLLTAAVMFWGIEAAGAFLGVLVFLKRKIMDVFMN